MKPLTTRFSLPPAEFYFASFAFPKWVWTIQTGPLSKRRERMDGCCGPSYHAPSGQPGGCAFYLDSDGAPGLRWSWADAVERSIRHTGWFTDDHGDGDKIRGIVARLPRGRGFIAGWSMGEGMSSQLDCEIYTDEKEAARAADESARIAAEREVEHEREQRAELAEA